MAAASAAQNESSISRNRFRSVASCASCQFDNGSLISRLLDTIPPSDNVGLVSQKRQTIELSAKCQKRTYAMQQPMSAKGQKRTLGRLFDDLVGAGDKCRRDGEANRFRCFEVDCQLECAGLLDRNFAWLFAGDDLLDVNRQAAKEFS